MANFFSGMIRGGVLAGVALATASVLLPARPKLPPADVAQSAPLDPAPATPVETTAQTPPADPTDPAATQIVTPDPVATEPAATEPAATVPAATVPAATEPAATEPAATEPAATEPAATKPAATEPAKPITPPTPEPQTPTVAKDALLDPSPEIAAPEPTALGAKMVAAPAAGTLPKIGSDTIAATSQAITTSQQAALQPPKPVTSAPATNGPPVQKYAAKFDDPGTKPLFAIILRDTGTKDVDRAALAALPFPITFAIDPDLENAAEAMAIYRAAGKEVVMLTAGLPDGATAQDLEQSFQTYETVLPETVAIMGPAKGGFQDNAVLAKLIVPVIAAQGRGLITFDRGLNSAAQNAVREGLVHATVFRQVDGGGESVSVIRRYLDRAVFKAAQDGVAVVMGETLPDTITALTEWSIEGRATDVTLAPVSALLR
jgi:polysaccharide deacetylase 2 family uncharacterized protein YibQ